MYSIRIMYSFIDFSKLKRFINFPYPVIQSGWTSLYAGNNKGIDTFRNLEVCIRLGGETKFSVDTINGKTYYTPFPHVIYKAPGMKLATNDFKQRESVYFTYSAEITERLIKDHLLTAGLIFQPFEMNGEIEAKILELRKLLTRSGEFSIADRVDLCCCGILEELKFLRSWKQNNLHPAIQMENVASFIETNLCKPLSVQDIAKQFGLSERTLYRYWHTVYPVSPGEYLRKCRLNRAKELLEKSIFPIRDIAKMFCFCDDNCFSTAFKQEFGITPRKIRQQRQKTT